MSETDERVVENGTEERRIALAGVDQSALIGVQDANLRFLQERFAGTLTVRDESMLLRSEQADELDLMTGVVLRLIDLLARDRVLDTTTVDYVLTQARDEGEEGKLSGETLLSAADGRRVIRARTTGQEEYVEAVRTHDVVFSIGPAGTGKTYLAVVMAMDYLRRGLVERIVLVRPAVEAGEQLGFLPGDLQDKIDPYLRPLYDALGDTIGPAKIQRYMQSGVIEAAPLAYMRGRTLNHAFVILDEAQNTTIGQMKMFLTRLGHESKAVITGDVTQVDLDGGRKSGLILVSDILARTDGIAFVELTQKDVVRHPLVKRIVAAFAEAEENENRGS